MESKEFVFNEETHVGMLGDTVIPSVTQLLSEFGLIDFSCVNKEILQYKASLGKAVHKAIQLFEDGTLNKGDLHPDVESYLSAYIQFKQDTGYIPMVSEKRFYSKRYRFTAGIDSCGLLKGAMTLIDYKTTYRMCETTAIQLSAYELMLQDQLGIRVKNRIGLLLKSDGSYEIHKFKSNGDLQTFLACLHLHWVKRNHR